MSNMILQLQLKLQDQLSSGMKAALKSIQDATKNTKREMDALSKAANNIKPTGIERLSKALREVRSLSKSTLDALNKTAQAGAAISAGGYVAKRALDRPMAYDRQLALTANVAFSDRSVAGRIAGKMELDKAVRQAQRNGMGSQEDVLQTLNDLIGSGAMGGGQQGVKSSIAMLPTIAAASSGTGANPADIAKIVMAAKQNMNMSDAEAARFISQSITAGNLGGFEIKDMARYLPEQMASAAANGMKGVKGAQDLLAFNQAARITAGNSDQAGNNVVNLLNKMSSVDTQRDFKKQGINLTGSLVASREKGVGTLDAFLALVDKVASKNPEYKKLQARAAGQSGADQKQTYEAMMDIMEQSGIGAVVQDRQAMAALLGARQNKAKMNEIRAAVQADDGSQVRNNMAVVNSTSSAAAERAANAKDQAANSVLSAIDGPLQSVLKTTTDLSIANPVLAASAYAAATALGVVAATAGVGAILKGGKGAAVARGAAAIAGPVAAAAGAAGALPIAAGVVGLGVAAYSINGLMQDNAKRDPVNHPGMKYERHGRTGGAWVKDDKPIVVNVHLDGKQVASSTNKQNGRTASRH